MAIKTFSTGEVLTASDTNTYLANAGLVYVTSTTIGSAVSSVTVSNVFSSTYDNYLITVTGGVGSVAQNIGLQLGSTTTGYYGGLVTVNTAGTVAGFGMNNDVNFSFAGISTTTNNYVNTTLFDPFNAKTTRLHSVRGDDRTAGSYGTATGFLNNTTSYTAFTLIVTGTMTGGTITVYGYRKA